MIAQTPEMVAAMKQLGQPPVVEARGRYSEFEPQRRLQLTQMIDFFKDVQPYENALPDDRQALSSYHQVGHAADVWIDGIENRDLFDYCRTL